MAGEPQALLIKDHRRKWALPKGHIDSGETSVDAAVREIHEETGIRARILERVGEMVYYYRAEGKLIEKHCDIYLLECVGDPTLHPDRFDPHEQMINDARWFGLDEAVRHVAYNNAKNLVARAVARIRERARG